MAAHHDLAPAHIRIAAGRELICPWHGRIDVERCRVCPLLQGTIDGPDVEILCGYGHGAPLHPTAEGNPPAASLTERNQ